MLGVYIPIATVKSKAWRTVLEEGTAGSKLRWK